MRRQLYVNVVSGLILLVIGYLGAAAFGYVNRKPAVVLLGIIAVFQLGFSYYVGTRAGKDWKSSRAQFAFWMLVFLTLSAYSVYDSLLK